MISQQIAIKPFLGRIAEREKTSYADMLKSAAQDMAALPVEEFLSSKEAKSAQDMGQLLRINAQEVQSELAQQNVDPRVATFFVQNMAITALAMEPGTAVALDGAMRLLMMGEKPLAESSVKEGQLQLAPSLEHVAGQMGTDVNGLLLQVTEEYKAHPELDANQKARLDSTINTASVFQLNPSEVGQLQERLAQHGVTGYQSDAIVSSLVMNAVAYEPTLRSGLDGIFGIYYRGEKPLAESSYQPVQA